MNPEEKTILYVDDDPDDREIVLDAIGRVAPEIKVLLADNGVQALNLLHTNGSENLLPCLIVLDLNMPYLDGRQTYEQIRKDPQLKHIPLVILTSGENPIDKAYFTNEGVTYFNKPLEFSHMSLIASQIVSACHAE